MRTTRPSIRKASISVVRFSNRSSSSSSSVPRNDRDNKYEDAPDDEASWYSPTSAKPKPVLVSPTSLKSLREGGNILYRSTYRGASQRTTTATATDRDRDRDRDREPTIVSNRRRSRFGAAEDDERPSYIIEVPLNNDDATLISSLAEEFRGSRPLPPPRTMVFHRKEVPGAFDILDYDEEYEYEYEYDESGGCQGVSTSSQDIPLFSLFCPVPENAQELLFGGGAASNDDEEDEQPCYSSPTTRRSPRGSHPRPRPRDADYLELKHDPLLDKIIPPVSSSSTSSSTRSSPSSAVAREIEQLFQQAQSTITEHVDQVRLQLTALQSSWLPPIPPPTTAASTASSTHTTGRRRRRSNESDPGGPHKMQQQQQHPPHWAQQPSYLSLKTNSYGEDSLWNFQEDDDQEVDDGNSTKASVIIHILQQ
jgi:hypothetical protein